MSPEHRWGNTCVDRSFERVSAPWPRWRCSPARRRSPSSRRSPVPSRRSAPTSRKARRPTPRPCLGPRSPASGTSSKTSTTSRCIVTTGRRRSEFLQETPVSATVLSGSMLEERGIDSLDQIGVLRSQPHDGRRPEPRRRLLLARRRPARRHRDPRAGRRHLRRRRLHRARPGRRAPHPRPRAARGAARPAGHPLRQEHHRRRGQADHREAGAGADGHRLVLRRDARLDREPRDGELVLDGERPADRRSALLALQPRDQQQQRLHREHLQRPVLQRRAPAGNASPVPPAPARVRDARPVRPLLSRARRPDGREVPRHQRGHARRDRPGPCQPVRRGGEHLDLRLRDRARRQLPPRHLRHVARRRLGAGPGLRSRQHRREEHQLLAAAERGRGLLRHRRHRAADARAVDQRSAAPDPDQPGAPDLQLVLPRSREAHVGRLRLLGEHQRRQLPDPDLHQSARGARRGRELELRRVLAGELHADPLDGADRRRALDLGDQVGASHDRGRRNAGRAAVRAREPGLQPVDADGGRRVQRAGIPPRQHAGRQRSRLLHLGAGLQERRLQHAARPVAAAHGRFRAGGARQLRSGLEARLPGQPPAGQHLVLLLALREHPADGEPRESD